MPDFILNHSDPMGLLACLYVVGLAGLGLVAFIGYAIYSILEN